MCSATKLRLCHAAADGVFCKNLLVFSGSM